MVEWENGELTYEPLELMIKDDPISVAQYASEKNLLELPGWKRLRRYTKNKKKLKRMVKQAKLASQRRGPIYMFGVRVPRNSREAEVLDKENGKTKWQDAMYEERDQLDDYTTFKNLGKGIFPKDKGYKRINVHFVFAVKHDLRYKARLVAGGHLTDPAKESIYSGVVTLKSMRITMLIAELKLLETMVGDVGNAYLEAYTKEKL